MSYWGSSYGSSYGPSYGYGAGTYGYSSSRWGHHSEPEDLLDEGKENDGRIGLSNIGNTCFMNSALQCIFHNDLLKRFFLQPNIEAEINEANPLGTKGVLFREIAKLFQQYFRTKASKVAPYKFKTELGVHNPMFEGYQQHDSQEFWSYVIDVIHEDSNRILNKPYVANVEGKGKENDGELGRLSWVAYLKRNYSVVTDNFIGQFKSRVDCTTTGCGNTSVTFDPFTIISLSIPNLVSGRFDYLMSGAEDASELFESSFNAQSVKNYLDIKVQSLREVLARKNGKDPNRLRIALLSTSSEGMVFDDNDTLGRIQEKRGYGFVGKPFLFLAEISESDAAFADNPNALAVLFSVKRDTYDLPPEKKSAVEDYYSLSYSYRKTVPWDEVQYARFLYITANSTIRDLHIAILKKLYSITSLCPADARSRGALSHADAVALWSRIEAAGSTERFFYLKHEDRLLSRNLMDCSIESEIPLKSGKLDIKVFIRGTDVTTVQVDLNQKTHFESWQTANAKKEEDFVSPQGSVFENKLTLEGLLRGFEKTEVLDEENLWRCPACKNEVAAKKSMWIYKAPNYLTIHFKKMKGYQHKVPEVTFPLTLDMNEFVQSKQNLQGYQVGLEEFMSAKDIQAYADKGVDPKVKVLEPFGNGLTYRLYGIVNHYGSQNFGHYTSACEWGGQWFDFNDSSVGQTAPDKVATEEAYILFYKRVN
jgi:ubiquitin carboxyl-terminal hydrolase 4/11/15